MTVLASTVVRCTALVAALACGRQSAAQGTGRVAPERPHSGDTIRVSYSPPLGKAPQQVTAVVFLYFPIKGATKATTLGRDSEGFHGLIALPRELSSGIVHFIIDGTWDEAAARPFVILRDDGRLARGAHSAAFVQTDASKRDALLSESLALYPDYVQVYRDRWLAGRMLEEPGIIARIQRDLSHLAATRDTLDDQYLYTRMSGLLLVGDYGRAWDALTRIVTTCVESPYTGRALQRYRFERLSAYGVPPLEMDQIGRWATELSHRHPDSDFARENLVFDVADTAWSLSAIDSIADAWTIAEPTNPLPRLYKGEARVTRHVLDSSDVMARSAVEQLLSGQLFRYGTLSEGSTQDRIREAYQVWSRAEVLKGDTTLAIALAATASSLKTPTDGPDAALLAGTLWSARGQLRFAEREFYRAQVGGTETRDELEAIQARTIDADVRYEKYLDGVAQWSAGSRTPHYLPAFVAKGISGSAAGSQSLLGRVSVLTFWFTSCPPCLAEIPKLNIVTTEFANAGVRFVAYALDDDPTVRRFLRSNPFRYQIVADGAAIGERLGVDAYPMHILVDRQGRIRLVVKGGEPTTIDRLRSGIATLRKE